MQGAAGDGEDPELNRFLSFWFSPGMEKKWFFISDPSERAAFDREVQTWGEDLYHRSLEGELRSWMETPSGVVALCLLWDQFPRNAYRGTPRAFATDALALFVAHHALMRGLDRPLRSTMRLFLYLPFEHSEAMENQARSVALLRSIYEDLDKDGFAGAGALNAALQHVDLIHAFGRFPGRNEVLGRQSSSDELAYLAKPGANF